MMFFVFTLVSNYMQWIQNRLLVNIHVSVEYSWNQTIVQREVHFSGISMSYKPFVSIMFAHVLAKLMDVECYSCMLRPLCEVVHTGIHLYFSIQGNNRSSYLL
jgi:hypothetical protein